MHVFSIVCIIIDIIAGLFNVLYLYKCDKYELHHDGEKFKPTVTDWILYVFAFIVGIIGVILLFVICPLLVFWFSKTMLKNEIYPEYKDFSLKDFYVFTIKEIINIIKKK